jgi:hypothetical protein
LTLLGCSHPDPCGFGECADQDIDVRDGSMMDAPKPDSGDGGMTDGMVDGGSDADSSVLPEAGDCHPDAGSWDGGPAPVCPTPRNVMGWVPDTLPPPVGKHTGACTQQQLDLYHQCTVQSNMSACMQVQQLAMTTFKTCLTCLETTSMDPQWGPLVCVDQQTCYLNVEGCMNLAVGQSGCMSCGQLLHESYGCQRVACEEQCNGDAQGFSKCVQTALAGGCKSYGDAFTKQCGNYTADPDGGTPDLDNCFRRQSEINSGPLRVRMDTFFCGN